MSRQVGFFDEAFLQEDLLKKSDFLERLRLMIPWEKFRWRVEKALNRKERGAQGGRPPFDAVFMFKILVLQALYNLSDEQTEFQLLDRLSFMRFLGLKIGDKVPDARTIWLFRETLAKANAVEKLFALFDGYLLEKGLAASGGQLIDASFVEAPKQRNSREENAQVKAGETPADWSNKKVAHKDVDARWAVKNKRSHYGYKNHINIDRTYKIIRRYKVTDASVHDSQTMDAILQQGKNKKEVWADSAYRSEDQEERLKERGFTSQIHERAYRNSPLSEEKKESNTAKSRVRARVEHVFGHIETCMSGSTVRTVGILRANAKIGLMNLAYNFSRFLFLLKHPVTA